jgi:hypothetical protein
MLRRLRGPWLVIGVVVGLSVGGTVAWAVAQSDRLRAYLEAWNTLDPVTAKNRYLDNGTHRGPGVVMLSPDLPDPTLHGKDAIHDFAVACGGVESDMTVTWALEATTTSVVEYDLRFEGGEQKWAEIIQWEGDRARRVHAYLLPTAG